jgi:hypothetical protein
MKDMAKIILVFLIFSISVDYIFQKQGDKWIMVKIIDQST